MSWSSLGLRKKLGKSQKLALSVLSEAPKTVQALGLPASTIRRLEERGLIARRVGDKPKSQRGPWPYEYFLTELGKKAG